MKRAFAVLTFVVSTLLLSAGVSSARTHGGVGPGIEPLGGCVGNICGSVMNESNHTVWAIRNWGDASSSWHALAPRTPMSATSRAEPNIKVF